MNMRIFLFTVVLFIATISLSPVNNADAGIGFKQKIYASGFGASLETSKNAPLEIRKQEAFIAAFLDGIRNIAEQIAELEKLPTIGGSGETTFYSLRKKVAGFEVDSRIIMKEGKIEEDVMVVKFGGQIFIIKDSCLISPPVEFVEFPKWDKPPTAIPGIQIEDLEWEENDEGAVCTIKLLYHYDVTNLYNYDATKK